MLSFFALVLIGSLAASSAAQFVHQDQPQSQPQPHAKDTLGGIFAQIQEQDEIRRAGLRAGVLRQAQTVLPMVVVVEDANSYLFAISNWEGMIRFPVLWDDGSAQSHEDIARFVRAFMPEKVVRLRGHVSSPWAGTRENRQAIFEMVLGESISSKAPDWDKQLDSLRSQGIVSPGVVVCDVLDPAWPGALALAAGRLQMMVFVENPGTLYKPMSVDESDALEVEIERAVQQSGRTWKAIGDEIDTITLALNTGTMIKTGQGVRDRLATSDRIGRRDSKGSGTRWAYCGQIFGKHSRSTYQAMCALFLQIDQGFVWDGYRGGEPWSQYDGLEAGETLKQAGLDTEINDEPKNTLKDWRLRMVRPVGKADHEPGSAGIFLMNSKGASNAFGLPGTSDEIGRPGYMPMFNVPMAMHMVHSFSLQRPFQRKTIGGRLLERGVFAYAGSVDEPYLSAFVPTPAIARRLGGAMCFGAAVRYDNGKVWKIAVLGDPLITFGPSGQRAQESVEVPGSIDLALRYKDRLKNKDYLGAIEDLTMLGNDQAATRIGMALLKDQPKDFDSDIARVLLPAFFRVGEYTTILDAFDRLDSEGQSDGVMQDILWLSSPYLLARSSGRPEARGRIHAMLRANIREDQRIYDAETLAMSLRKQSLADAVGVLESLRPTLNANQSKALDRAIARVRK